MQSIFVLPEEAVPLLVNIANATTTGAATVADDSIGDILWTIVMIFLVGVLICVLVVASLAGVGGVIACLLSVPSESKRSWKSNGSYSKFSARKRSKTRINV